MTPRIPDVGSGALLIYKLRQRFPATDTERFSDAYWNELQKDCALHVAIGQFFFPLGLLVRFSFRQSKAASLGGMLALGLVPVSPLHSVISLQSVP
jgi:hypothetical protein